MRHKTNNHALIAYTSPASEVSEQYRSIQTNLFYTTVDHPVKTILVTSTADGEGKTTLLCNLGISYAEIGKRVLLVDANFRRPMLHQIMGGKNVQGLAQGLMNPALLLQAVVDTSIPNLKLLPSGMETANPTKLLSAGLEQALKELSKHFDLVLVDSPSLASVSDSQVAAACCDGVVLVVRYGRIKQASVHKTVEKLKLVKARILGTVISFRPRHEQR